MSKKALLMILDGWGIGDQGKDDVIFNTPTPYWDSLLATYPHSQLQASGENVGLPDGQMGNSEVGHLNIGAGRIVYQDMTRIDVAMETGELASNAALLELLANVKRTGGRLHFAGLLSDGGVHSHINHLGALMDIAAAHGVDVRVHAFMDGRDTSPTSGAGFLAQLGDMMARTRAAHSGVSVEQAALVGRFYAMDRDKRWERVKVAYDALVNGVGEHASDMVAAVQKSYDEGVTDEFIKPFVRIDENGQPVGMIRPNDVVVFFNYRNDRAKELTIVLTQEDMPAEGMHTMPLYYCCMTPYDAKFTGLHILFDKDNVPNTIGEFVSKQGLRQLRIAETEKYAHVTFFFNGGVEAPYEGEDRCVIPSPKVATYDLKPEMSAYEVADECAKRIRSGKYDVVILNFANCDMVGHTGVFDAAVKAVEAVDACVETVWEAVRDMGGCMFLTADHGNADKMENPDGTPFTAHTTNPVPFLVAGCGNVELRAGGCLADIAPTMLPYIGLPVPKEMTGKSIIED